MAFISTAGGGGFVTNPNKGAIIAGTSGKGGGGKGGGIGSVVTNPTLTFGGVAEPPVTTTQLGYSGVPTSGNVHWGATASDFVGNLFGAFGGGTSTSAASGPAGGPPPVSVNTAQVDGSTGFISGLRGQLGDILGAIGSTGDETPAGAYQVAYGSGEGKSLDMGMIALVLAVGLGIYVISTRSK